MSQQPENFTWYQKFVLGVMNINALFLFLPLCLFVSSLIFIMHPVLVFIQIAVFAFFAKRYWMWFEKKPKKLPLYVVPLTNILIVSALFGGYILSGLTSVEVYIRAGACMTSILWVAYKLWPYATRYVSYPIMKKIWSVTE